MPTTYSTAPYHDDYDETKQFYRMLFRPGRAVQARELTQLQTLLQGQIERFGKNIFKDGSIVIPAEQVFDTRYSFVKLQESYNSVNADDVIDNLVDSIVIGQTSGVRAVVVNFQVATTTDEPTIYVKYLNSGTDGVTKTFADNEIIQNEAATISVRAISSSATGTGSAYSVGVGALFVKGSFVYINEQTKILSKYSVVSNTIVGFDVTESVVTSDDDESLLDPAIDTFNYFAPGADRYKISLALATRAFTASAIDDPNFVELARIEDGFIISQNYNPQYNILADTLARRTYDESGDYIVRPYQLKLKEHLRTSNANVTYSIIDGLYPSYEGGNADLFVNILTPGKAYVKGYEIDSVRTKYIDAEKARDFVAVNQGTVAAEIGNFVYVSNVYSVPNLADIQTIDVYNRYPESAKGTPSGSKIGTARPRHLEFYSGTVGTETAVYKLHLFNVDIDDGSTFVDDAKAFYFDNPSIPDFTAEVYPTYNSLTGAASMTSGSNVLTGSGTLFVQELEVGDYINLDSNTQQRFRVIDINNNNQANVFPNAAATITNVTYSIEKATLRESNKNLYVFPLPYEVIKSVDSTGIETTYTSKRQYTRTLSGGNVTITAGTDETFAPISSTNYSLVFGSGSSTGEYSNPTGNITRGGSPTGKTITVSLTGYTSESIEIITTVQKSQSAADKKTKTLVSDATIDFNSAADATASILSLGKADVFQIKSVSMSANAFGTGYFVNNATNITSRYTLDTGQRSTFYDLGRLTLNSGASKPTGPVRVTFDYFTHGTGDYFSVESYSGINYKDIPVFTLGDTDYFLRDCIDFRPRINDAGTGFTSTGSSTTEMIGQDVDFITDYEYYLPRTDKLVVDRSGVVSVVKGISSLNPIEPKTPDNAMGLYVLKQKPYVFDVDKDIEVFNVDNKRFTMRDIGRIENRVKNLEYYTSLNLLEKQAEVFQVKDAQGFDRFKNGFIVDSFTGHGIGDPFNADYSVAVDFNKKEARPIFEEKFVKVVEVNTTTAGRTGNNYVLVGDLMTLPYTEEKFISNDKASLTVNLNPFNIILFTGVANLEPPSDIWFETNRLPDVKLNQEGNYDSVLADAKAKGTYGTIWGNWRDLHYGNGGDILVQQREGIEYTVTERIDTTVRNDVVKSTSVLPKMRDVTIKIEGKGLKPSTKMYAFINDIPVTQYCMRYLSNVTSNISEADLNTVATIGDDLITDSTGNVYISFTYYADTLNLNTGLQTIRITDSPLNNPADTESFAEAVFNSSGELRNIANEITSTRNAVLNQKTSYDTREIYVGSPPSYDDYSPPNTTPPKPGLDFVSGIYKYAFGREPDPEGYAYWNAQASRYGVTTATIQAATTSGELKNGSTGAIDTLTPLPGGQYRLNPPASTNSAAQSVHSFVKDLVYAGTAGGSGGKNNETIGGSSIVGASKIMGVSDNLIAQSAANKIIVALTNSTASNSYNSDIQSMKSFGINQNVSWTAPGKFSV